MEGLHRRAEKHLQELLLAEVDAMEFEVSEGLQVQDSTNTTQRSFPGWLEGGGGGGAGVTPKCHFSGTRCEV